MLLYDYSGLWCVEGVWLGQLEIIQYQLLECEGECFWFCVEFVIFGDCGSVGSLILLYEYYIICNISDDELVILVYVYEGEMICSVVFEFDGMQGWYQWWLQVMEIDVVQVYVLCVLLFL